MCVVSIDRIPTPAAVADVHGTVIEANALAEELFAAGPGQLRGASLATLTGGCGAGITARLGAPLDAGRQVRVVVFERRTPLEAPLEWDRLLDEVKRFRTLAASAPIAIAIARLSPDGRLAIPYASPSLEELVGLSPEALARDVGPLFELMSADVAARVWGEVQRSGATLAPFRSDLRINHPVRGERWLDARATVVRDPDGSVYFYGFGADITEQKRMSEALRDSQERFSSVFRANPRATSSSGSRINAWSRSTRPSSGSWGSREGTSRAS